MDLDLLSSLMVGAGAGGLSVYLALKLTASKSSAVVKLEQEHTKYRAEVEEHFVKTAGLFKSLTDQYQDVYQHMAEGADKLCSEEVKALQSGLAEPGLLARSKEPDTSSDQIETKAAGEELPLESEDPVAEKSPKTADKEEFPLASEAELPTEMLDKTTSKS